MIVQLKVDYEKVKVNVSNVLMDIVILVNNIYIACE